MDKECVGNHNGYDDDFVHDIIKTLYNDKTVIYNAMY